MEFLPVGKRTRLQKAKMLKETNKRARLAAKREWRKRKEKVLVDNNGEKKVEILRVLKEEKMEEEMEIEEDVVIIDKDEFFKDNFIGSKQNSQIEELGIIKKEAFDDDYDHDKHEAPLFLDEKGKGIMMIDDVNGYGSDDSVQIIGERWNPLGLDGDYDDDDDDDDDDGDGENNDGASHSLAVVMISDSDDEMKGIHNKDEAEKVGEMMKKEDVLTEESSDYEASSSEDDDDDVFDKDFVGVEHESSHTSESSSSDGSVQEHEGELHFDDDNRQSRPDDGGDDDELNDVDDDGVENHDDDDDDDGVDDVENDDDDDALRHKKKRVTIDKEVEKERRQEGGEKRKRGRPPKKKSVKLQKQSPPCRNVVKKSKDNEIQNTLLNTILEVGNKGLDEIMSCKFEFYLPLKFKFGVEELILHEKTEEDLELDKLFKDFEFAIQASNIGSDDSSLIQHDNRSDSENINPSNGALSQKDLCAKGKHYLVHDDEIGIVCKFCSYVNLEIKHVMPDFNKDPFGRGDRRDYYCRFLYEGSMTYDRFQFLESSYDGRGDFSPSDDIQGTVWDLIPGVKKTLYPHQRDGFEFIWRNIAGGIRMDELGKPTKFGLGGCIICHAPGTGKTRLAIVFLQSFMKHYQNAKPVIVAPFPMLRTWEEEFGRWNVNIPFFNLNDNELSGKEDPKILGYVAKSSKDDKTIRLVKLHTWASGNGVLCISYGLLQRLAGDKEGTDEKVRQVLLEQSGILVLDEGHTPRNEKSNIWKVLSNISTKRRVILSGTPFQNNFEELHNTISLVRQEFGTPVFPGFYSKYERIEELRKKIKPFVHVHKGEILKETLKGLIHRLLILKPSPLQTRCFEQLVRIKNRFKFDNLVSIISVHPSIFCGRESKPAFVDEKFESLLKKHRMDLDAGVKTRFLVELIKLSKGERVLVFGQYIPPLNFIADLLKSVFGWSMGSELLYMHGKQDVKERQSSIRLFNDPRSKARVLLASTKACCEGIHLVGASRVVLLDVVWNPSVERQAISRAYRLGQLKDVFVYHLITSGTLEEEKYQRQATKERLSELVFSSAEENTENKSTRSRISEDRILKEMTDHEKMKHMFKRVIYQPKADNLIESFNMVL
ncbi:hypothetical protein BVRB_5g124950 [Beta vulgaris subsp. vulgaris]|uniref:Uncharacterized protein n=1 Tax=Beta vulgaris subsp. vulgaris TaxID=3555 RepID=A0A0J8E3H4_BETVV|nr:hypothetical protein BVRB_5g124950 [Beta vulgaris subsp. vulgaris]